jgi:hypothetical protein
MKHTLIGRTLVAGAVLPIMSLTAQAYAASGTVTYNRDSPNPNVGWHNDGPWRVCSQDCDNPEIPGSDFTCKDVTILGMPFRDCMRP